jgi:hypothetical protein
MTDERLFIVTYDISDQRRWRRVFKAMQDMATGFSFPFSSAVFLAGVVPSWRRDCVNW